jgi:hypothetical protein
MNSGRAIEIELSSTEIAILTEVMCTRAISMEQALRWVIACHRRVPSNDYMRLYMQDYRQAKKLGLEVMEFRRRKGATD